MSLCKKSMLFIIATFLLFRPLFICAQDNKPKIYLEGQNHSDTGLFILKIMLSPQDVSLCGLELDIIYDPAAMSVCSCERGDALSGLEFDCSLKEGRIRLLFWGGANSEGGGRIATLCFVPVESYDGEIEFTVSLPTKSSAIYFKDNKIHSQQLLLEGLLVDLGSPEISTEGSSQGCTDGATESATEGCTEGCTGGATENPTELPSETEQEAPSTETLSTETPSAEATEKTDNGTEIPTDQPPQSLSQGKRTLKKTLSALLYANTGAGLITIIPMILPRVFRKGYF